jgi:hypothetical protein
VCDNATDSDGNFYLYQALNIQGTAYECTGQVFSSYAVDGRNMSLYSAYIYDAAVAMVDGIVTYAQMYNGGLVPTKISGKKLKSLLIANTSFEGVSGNVTFSAERRNIYNYGHGDRIDGVRFALMSFSGGNGSASKFAFERVGTWRSGGRGFVPCTEELDSYAYSSHITGECFAFTHAIPADHASPVVQVMPDAIRAALYFLAALQLVAVMVFGIGLVHYRKKRLVKASQPPMMWLVLSIGIWSAARTIAGTVPISTGACIADYWTGHLAFSGIIALFVKSLRVHLLVNAGGLKRVKISTTQVMLFTFGILGFFVLYMLISTVVSVPHAAMRIRTAITGQDTHIYYCKIDKVGMDYFLYAFEAVILLLAAKLCYDTKNLPDAINETKVVAFGKFSSNFSSTQYLSCH